MSLCVVTVHNEISTGNHKTGVCESQSLVNVQATLLKDILERCIQHSSKAYIWNAN